MLLTGLCFVAVMVSVKFLSKDLPPTQAAFFRYLFGLILILPLIRLQFKKSIKKNTNFKTWLKRSRPWSCCSPLVFFSC